VARIIPWSRARVRQPPTTGLRLQIRERYALSSVRRPEAVIAGRYRGEDLTQVGRTVALSAQQSSDLGAVLEPAEDDHPWPDEIGVGRWSSTGATVRLTKVAPTVVVEVAADAALQAGQWRRGLWISPRPMSPRPTESLWTESLWTTRRRRRGASARLVRALAARTTATVQAQRPPAPAQARPVGRTALAEGRTGPARSTTLARQPRGATTCGTPAGLRASDLCRSDRCAAGCEHVLH
jgi:hypothetical protein